MNDYLEALKMGLLTAVSAVLGAGIIVGVGYFSFHLPSKYVTSNFTGHTEGALVIGITLFHLGFLLGIYGYIQSGGEL